MDTVLDAIKNFVRKGMRQVARLLNTVTFGRLHPNIVTFAGLAMHGVIAYLIAQQRLLIAAILLIIFGLFDALDGELARLQKRASPTGGLLDSVTDRMKEVLLYGGITYALVQAGASWYSVWAVLAIGGSLITSYINACGDALLARSKDHVHNTSFRGGLLRFEVRMFLLVVALATDSLQIFVLVIAVLAWLTALQRLVRVTRKLRAVESA